MKLLVLGHSDSDGSRLRHREDGLTWVLQRRVREETGLDLETVHKSLFAGPTAVDFVERQLERENPDIIILGLSVYAVVVELASNRVRERFGDGAARFVSRQEVRVGALAERFGPRGQLALRAPRKAARALLGTRPAFSFEALVDCYIDLFHCLARLEQVHTIVFGGLGFGLELQRLNPRLNELSDAFHVRLKGLADELHFDWTRHEDILGGRQAKLAYMQPDGVHSNEEGQRLAAEALLPLVVARL